ncbi:MAG: PAS domain S-box protein [Anaeromyxobacter sp.]|nr:PAS domain S-box protein [Anaeromyxobacter sp.]
MPGAAPPTPGSSHGLRARAALQQRRLLLGAAGLIAPYYLVFGWAGIYPRRALLVGLLIPLVLALAGWRLPRAALAEARAWRLAITAGVSGLAVTTALLASGTACIGFHVIWALPILYGILAPHGLTANAAGAAVSTLGGLFLMVRDGHPASQVLQWAVLALAAAAFSLNRVVLNRRDRRAGLEQERRAGEQLATSEGRYRLLAEHSKDVTWTLDLRSQRFTYVSPAILRQRGYTVEEALRQTLADALTPESLARAGAVLARLGTPEEEDPHLGVYDQPCRDGSVKHVEISATAARDGQGRPVEVIGLSRDVTPRVRAERALRRSEERFRALIEKSTDMIVVFDLERRISFWSAGATEALGWTAAEMLGHTLLELELVHPDDVAIVAEVTRQVEAGGGPARTLSRHRHRDGTWRLVEGLGRDLRADPAVQGVVVNARDVTEQHRLAAQLQQAQKLESIGRLAGGVAHDFNNVLTVILACGEALRRDLAAGQAIDPEDLSELRAAGERARDLTRQLLAFARKQVIAPVPLDLNQVARGSEKLLRRVLGEDLELRLELHPELWTAVCDPGQLDQVLLNLAVNARDAMPEGGTLVIATSNATVAREAAAGDPELHQGQWVRLEVRDSGTGMTPEAMAHLFEPFFTTKPQGAGTGLGLATVYGIVTQCGGHVHVHSRPGQGTTVLVCLPRAPAEAARPGGPEAATHPVVGGSELLLVVEDDPLVRAVTVRALQRAGYRVLVAEAGDEALRLVAQAAEPPALAVTDVVMPGMGGREVAEALRQRRPGLPVLYVSGYARDTIGPRELAVPRTAFLQKPFSAAALLAQVRGLLDAPRVPVRE